MANNIVCQSSEGLTCQSIIIESDGQPIVSSFADTLYNGYLPKERNIHLPSQSLGTFTPEKIVLIFRQFGRSKPSHIFNQSKNGDIHFIIGEHIDSLTCISQSHFLRSTDNNSSCDGQILYNSEMNITSTWREIDKEIIEGSPICISDKLFQGIASHTSTPKSGLVRINKETNGKKFQSVLLYRNDKIPSINGFCIGTRILHLKHLRYRRAENISIKQTYIVALLSQSYGQISSNGTLSNPTLTRGYGYNIFYLRQ